MEGEGETSSLVYFPGVFVSHSAASSLCLVVFAGLLLACQGTSGGATPAPSSGAAPQLFIRQPVEATSQLPFGGDCAAGGASQCESGLCIHSGLAPNERFRCSSPCSSPADCLAPAVCVDTAGMGVCVVGEAQ